MNADIGPKKPLIEPEYLGDGVHASFDGYHIWLAVNDHLNKVVALEPSVYASLVRYAKQIYRQTDNEV